MFGSIVVPAEKVRSFLVASNLPTRRVRSPPSDNVIRWRAKPAHALACDRESTTRSPLVDNAIRSHVSTQPHLTSRRWFSVLDNRTCPHYRRKGLLPGTCGFALRPQFFRAMSNRSKGREHACVGSAYDPPTLKSDRTIVSTSGLVSRRPRCATPILGRIAMDRRLQRIGPVAFTKAIFSAGNHRKRGLPDESIKAERIHFETREADKAVVRAADGDSEC